MWSPSHEKKQQSKLNSTLAIGCYYVHSVTMIGLSFETVSHSPICAVAVSFAEETAPIDGSIGQTGRPAYYCATHFPLTTVILSPALVNT